MPRPENLNDIELEPVQFASITVENIHADPALLKGYTAFLEAVTKAGAIVDKDYRGINFFRNPTMTEAESQLRNEQDKWDRGHKAYTTYASLGRCEANWEEQSAEQWASSEKLPWPPEVEEIKAFDAVIRDIDDAVSA